MAEDATRCLPKPFPLRLQPRSELLTARELGSLQQVALVQGSRLRQIAPGAQALELQGVHRDGVGKQVDPVIGRDEALSDQPFELEQGLPQ